MSKEILFSNGAIQNQEFSLDEKPYKALGIVTARVLNELVGNDASEDVHNWNNVGLFENKTILSRDSRLQQKYDSVFMQNFLKKWEIDTPVIRGDDDNEFAIWAIDVLERSLKQGYIYKEKEEFVACRGCDRVIAEAKVKIDDCKSCGNNDFKAVVEEGLFVDTPEDPTTIYRSSQLVNRINLKHEQKQLDQLPRRLLLSRDREGGVRLDRLGLPSKNIEPKLAIGMLAVYNAAKSGYSQAGFTQSLSTFNRIMPYLNGVLPDPFSLEVPEIKYAFYSKINPELLDGTPKVSNEMLMFNALGQRGEINVNGYKRIAKEDDAIKMKIEALKRIPSTRKLIDDMKDNLEGWMDGRKEVSLTGQVGKLSKDLGRSLEYSKHKREMAPDELAFIKHALSNYLAFEKLFLIN